jgi:hypothetical protein
MISTLIFILGLVIAGFTAFTTRDRMYVTGTDRWGDSKKMFNTMWILKPIGIFVLGIEVSIK